MIRSLSAVLTGALVLLVAGPARPHSLLLASSPAADTTVSVPPTRLSLRFNNRIEKALSRLRLVDARGETRALTVSREGNADELQAPVPPLRPGRYRVEWRVLSTDGHVVSGVFEFRIES